MNINQNIHVMQNKIISVIQNIPAHMSKMSKTAVHTSVYVIIVTQYVFVGRGTDNMAQINTDIG